MSESNDEILGLLAETVAKWHEVSSAAGEPSVTIVADAVEFCRLAAQRIAPADLDAGDLGATVALRIS